MIYENSSEKQAKDSFSGLVVAARLSSLKLNLVPKVVIWHQA